MSSTGEVQQYIMSVVNCELPFIADMLYLKLTEILNEKRHYSRVTEHCCEPPSKATEMDATELISLLQRSAVEHLTTYRQLQAEKFCPAITIVTTDFEALYAYKRGDYWWCLLLSTVTVHTLLYAKNMPTVLIQWACS